MYAVQRQNVNTVLIETNLSLKSELWPVKREETARLLNH